MKKPRVLVPLGPGFEELEAIAAIDVLRRAGAHVVTASVGARNPIVGRNRIRVLADLDIEDALLEWGTEWDLVVLPGGLGGVAAIEAHEGLTALIAGRVAGGQLVGAICAAPRVLAQAGLARDTPITNHPGCRSDLSGFSSVSDDAVVDAGAVVTSRGPGTAVAFGLVLVAKLFGAEKAAEIGAEIAR